MPNISTMQLLSPTTNSRGTDPLGLPQECAEELLDALPPVMRFLRKHMRGSRDRGLSVPQFRAMVFLRTMPAAKLSAVAEFLGASMPTTSRIVSGLVNKGLVRRCERCNDRRCVELALTARGAQVAEKSHTATRALLASEFEALSEEDREALLRAMKSLRSLFAPSVRLAAANS